MAHTVIAEAGRVQSFVRKAIKQHMLASVWDQLSNRFTYNQGVPKADARMMPTTIVTKVSDEFRDGEWKTTMISIRKPNANAIIGPNPAEGRESRSSTKIVSVFYNVQRFAMAISDRSVGGNIGKFYNALEYNVGVMKDLFVEQTDYDHQKAVIDGADIGLTDASYWQNSEYGSEISNPVDPVLHPNVYTWHDNAISKNTWSATYATATVNLEGLLDDMDADDIFNLSALDAIYLIASRKISPIGGIGGNNEVRWVLKISDAQWHQLVTDTAANGWKDLLKYTESGFDRVFMGYVGVYKNMMIIVDQRAPLAAIASNNTSFQYITPAGDNRVRAVTNGTTGTFEVAMLFGLGALGVAMIEEEDLMKKGFDYDFNNGACMTRTRGTMRLDLDATVAPTTARINETSFLFLTATTSSVITA